MFIGHFAPAFAARALSEESPKLGTLFIAAQLVDWAFYIFAIVGIEHYRVEPGFTVMKPFAFYDYPITHSLLGTGIWAFGFALLVLWRYRNTVAATWAAIVVLSHWLLDFVSHGPDLTLAGGEVHYGLGLWNHPATAIAVELALTLGAFAWYMARTKGPLLPPYILLAVLLLLQTINWLDSGPAEVTVGLSLMALAAFAVVTALAYWVQSTRWHKNKVGLAVPSVRR